MTERVVLGEVVGVADGNGVGHNSLANTEVTIGSEALLLLAEDSLEIRVVSIPDVAHR